MNLVASISPDKLAVKVRYDTWLTNGGAAPGICANLMNPMENVTDLGSALFQVETVGVVTRIAHIAQ
jgi:hypothetical protein